MAAYSLLEAGLLLGILRPNFLIEGYQSKYYMVVSFGQLLLIPGLAALFSRLIYGPSGWGRQALKIVCGVAVGVVVSILVIVGFALLLDSIGNANFGFGTGSGVSSTISTLLFLAFVAGIVWLLWSGFNRSAKKSIELESARWLAERRAGVSATQRQWRNRGIRWASCVPCVIVLLVFFFLPESEYVVATLNHPKPVQMGNYKLRVPSSWLVLTMWRDDGDGQAGASGLIGLQMQHDLGTYIHGHLALSEWRMELRPVQSHYGGSWWDAKTPVARRVIAVDSDSVVYFEYNQPYYRHPSGIAVECSGPRGLHASLSGEMRHIAEFYRTIGEITVEGK